MNKFVQINNRHPASQQRRDLSGSWRVRVRQSDGRDVESTLDSIRVGRGIYEIIQDLDRDSPIRIELDNGESGAARDGVVIEARGNHVHTMWR